MTSRRRPLRASSREVRSSISTPAFVARTLRASGKDNPSRFMTKLKMSPPSPHPKHFHESRTGVTVNDGVFSPWKGHRPLYVAPAFFSWTVSPTTSTTLSLFLTLAATPTAKPTSRPGRPPELLARLTYARRGCSSASTTRTQLGACQVLTSRMCVSLALPCQDSPGVLTESAGGP